MFLRRKFVLWWLFAMSDCWFRRFLQFILLFYLSLGLGACSEGVNAGESRAHTDVAEIMHPSPSVALTQLITDTPAPTDSPLPIRTTAPVVRTRLALEAPPTNTPTALPCWSKGGNIRIGKLQTILLKEALNYRLYLPPCYDQQHDRGYPVLYLFHGQGFTDEQWDRIGIDEAADALIASGKIPPLIIAMPHEYGSEPPMESKFAQAFIEDFIPYIDGAYRTLPDRVHRAVGGLSRGGGWAVHFGISKWELFGALGAHSPGIFLADDLHLGEWLDSIPRDSYPLIYIDIGDRDLPEILESTIWFEKLLNEKDVPHEWHYFTGYHNEDYWRAHLQSYLRWYTQNW